MNFMYKIHIQIRVGIVPGNQNKRKNSYMYISEIRVQILKNEELYAQILNKGRNLCTNLNKPTRLHHNRRSKTSSVDNNMVSLKSESVKIISKFSTNNCVC